MKKIKVLLSVSLTILILSSCSMMAFRNNKARGNAGIVRIPQFTDPTQGTFLWSHYDATKRGSVMYVKDGKIRVLSENSPDAALQSITAITAKANIGGKVDAEVAFNTQRTIAQLGKRTAAVNMLRDALYRLNEMYYATVDEKNEYKKLLIEKKINTSQYEELIADSQVKTRNIDEKQLVDLFKNIIEKAKEISIAEADAETKISKAESDVAIKKTETEAKKYEALITIVQKIEGNLTKEKAEELLKEILKK